MLWFDIFFNHKNGIIDARHELLKKWEIWKNWINNVYICRTDFFSLGDGEQFW